jgi:hypothetical protein
MKLAVGQRWLRIDHLVSRSLIIEVTATKNKILYDNLGKVLQIISGDDFYRVGTTYDWVFENWGNVEYIYLEGQDK